MRRENIGVAVLVPVCGLRNDEVDHGRGPSGCPYVVPAIKFRKEGSPARAERRTGVGRSNLREIRGREAFHRDGCHLTTPHKLQGRGALGKPDLGTASRAGVEKTDGRALTASCGG